MNSDSRGVGEGWERCGNGEYDRVGYGREVVMAVMKAKGEGEDIHIDQESAEAWYGALNQARLEWESEFQFGQREEIDPDEIKDDAARAAFYRSDFYTAVQSLLLRYVMSD